MPDHRPGHGGLAIHSHNHRTSLPTSAEAGAWADVLVRRQLVHAAVLAPNGQWLVQHCAESPVRVLNGPAAMVELAAEIQHRIRTTRHRTR
ncbi:hypothetical protein QQY66_34195 [Streptomyces sp. DG2A-72]|uniref:hypothetical protein n=1 Tax=Streptomyces sp. DG2A-72 TaxID=3051386 RepID=UPI00265C82E7|nr:hypothetical protein [Streptomyces sp. DG2A-72]MDO0936512.1 hypothetical protein [Streptomyces sp. DG2A-72]